MERFLLDIEYLPHGKVLFIEKMSNKLMPEEKLNFIKGLIYLGFSTVRQEDVSFASGNIGKLKTSGENKLRMHLSNPALENFLNKQNSKKVKRSFIYALLYAGVNNFISFQEKLADETINKKELERIERLLFLSGLSSYFDNKVDISITNNQSKSIVINDVSMTSNQKVETKKSKKESEPSSQHKQRNPKMIQADLQVNHDENQEQEPITEQAVSVAEVITEFEPESIKAKPAGMWASKFNSIDVG